MLDKCLPADDPNNQWSYCPSVAAALAFFVLFGLTTLCHLIQAIRHRKPFCSVIIMGGLWETASFAFRILSARKPTDKGPYDVSFLLLLLAPVFINAFDYMLLGRMVEGFLIQNTLFGIKGSKMGVIFVCCDVISFIVQIGGGLLSLSNKVKTANLGLHVYTGGVVFQQTLIVFFLGLTIRFTQKLRRELSGRANDHGAKRLTYVLRASLFLISYRIIFRIIEFTSPHGSKVNTYINKHEYFVYCFDAGPMFLALIIMNFWHPGKVLIENSKRRLEDDSVYEITRPTRQPVPWRNEA